MGYVVPGSTKSLVSETPGAFPRFHPLLPFTRSPLFREREKREGEFGKHGKKWNLEPQGDFGGRAWVT
jgi:hypothetical protein